MKKLRKMDTANEFPMFDNPHLQIFTNFGDISFFIIFFTLGVVLLGVIPAIPGVLMTSFGPQNEEIT